MATNGKRVTNCGKLRHAQQQWENWGLLNGLDGEWLRNVVPSPSPFGHTIFHKNYAEIRLLINKWNLFEKRAFFLTEKEDYKQVVSYFFGKPVVNNFYPCFRLCTCRHVSNLQRNWIMTLLKYCEKWGVSINNTNRHKLDASQPPAFFLRIKINLETKRSVE